MAIQLSFDDIGKVKKKKTTFTIIPWGIQTEKADYRAHLSISTNMLYLYSVKAGIAAVNSGRYERKPAEQTVNGEKVITGYGSVVAWDEIEGVVAIPIPDDLKLLPEHGYTTSEKGRSAEYVFREMSKRGLVSLPIIFDEVTDKETQISGVDMVSRKPKVQVKYDGPVGRTGNLYLQTDEANPNKLY